MIDPKLTISLFKLRTKKALVKQTYTANVYGKDGDENMGHALAELIKFSREQKSEYYWSFSRYARNHAKADLQEMTAVMLEYPYSCRSELLDALDASPFVHYLIHTQDEINTKKAEERLLVAFPLVSPVIDPKDYTRIASLLSEQLGVGSHSTGDFSSTFLFCPFLQVCSLPKIVLNDAEKEFLDPVAFKDEHAGVWTNARALQEGQPSQPKPMKLDATGLFQF